MAGLSAAGLNGTAARRPVAMRSVQKMNSSANATLNPRWKSTASCAASSSRPAIQLPRWGSRWNGEHAADQLERKFPSVTRRASGGECVVETIPSKPLPMLAPRMRPSATGSAIKRCVVVSSTSLTRIAARSGDYDATLALWTTGYLLAGYMYVHDSPSRRRLWLLLCTVGIVMAFLTKSVQGLIFLPALLIYVVLQIPIVEILRSPAAYVSGATVLLSCAGYYFTREQIDPGYFAAAMANDPGRYVTVLDNHVLGPLYYIQSFPLISTSLRVCWVPALAGSR